MWRNLLFILIVCVFILIKFIESDFKFCLQHHSTTDRPVTPSAIYHFTTDLPPRAETTPHKKSRKSAHCGFPAFYFLPQTAISTLVILFSQCVDFAVILHFFQSLVNLFKKLCIAFLYSDCIFFGFEYFGIFNNL